MHWYYVENGGRVGPLSDKDFEDRVTAGRVRPETLVWNETLKEWTAWSRLRPAGMAPDAAPPPSAAAAPSPVPVSSAVERCSQCGTEHPREEMMVFEGKAVCAACKPAFLQRLREGVSVSGAMVYAGFWIRFGAWFIDALIGAVVGFFISFAIPSARQPAAIFTGMACLANLLGVLFAVSYETFFVGKFGATPGKMALGLKVIRPDGSPISYGRACGRYFAKVLSALILLIGYIMAAFDEEKRALHDRICDTRVVRA